MQLVECQTVSASLRRIRRHTNFQRSGSRGIETRRKRMSFFLMKELSRRLYLSIYLSFERAQRGGTATDVFVAPHDEVSHV